MPGDHQGGGRPCERRPNSGWQITKAEGIAIGGGAQAGVADTEPHKRIALNEGFLYQRLEQLAEDFGGPSPRLGRLKEEALKALEDDRRDNAPALLRHLRLQLFHGLVRLGEGECSVSNKNSLVAMLLLPLVQVSEERHVELHDTLWSLGTKNLALLIHEMWGKPGSSSPGSIVLDLAEKLSKEGYEEEVRDALGLLHEVWKETLDDWKMIQKVDPESLETDLANNMPETQRSDSNCVKTPAGELRIPVTNPQWISELGHWHRIFGPGRQQPVPYWCYVAGGNYHIGGWDGADSCQITLQEYWIASVPVTNAQFAEFVGCGYGNNAERWWTSQGWQWRVKDGRTQPQVWTGFSKINENHPVTGVTWYEATAFCRWLTESLASALPKGYVIRLPTEAEWEVAAAYDERKRRRRYPWGNQNTSQQRAEYKKSPLAGPSAVASYPAGRSACGAFDLAGTVWELSCSRAQDYPRRSHIIAEDFGSTDADVVWRGGSYRSDPENVGCHARDTYCPLGMYNGLTYHLEAGGFRVAMAIDRNCFEG